MGHHEPPNPRQLAEDHVGSIVEELLVALKKENERFIIIK